MRSTFLCLAGIFLFSAFARSATLSDNAGLKIELEDNGNIAGVELGGAIMPKGSCLLYTSPSPRD